MLSAGNFIRLTRADQTPGEVWVAANGIVALERVALDDGTIGCVVRTVGGTYYRVAHVVEKILFMLQANHSTGYPIDAVTAHSERDRK